MLTLDGALHVLASSSIFVWLVPHEVIEPIDMRPDVYMATILERFPRGGVIIRDTDEPVLYRLAVERAVSQLRSMPDTARVHVDGGTTICIARHGMRSIYRTLFVARLVQPPVAKAGVRRGRARQRVHFIPHVVRRAG